VILDSYPSAVYHSFINVLDEWADPAKFGPGTIVREPLHEEDALGPPPAIGLVVWNVSEQSSTSMGILWNK